MQAWSAGDDPARGQHISAARLSALHDATTARQPKVQTNVM